MKKLLLAVPLVAGAAWAGTSYYAGSQSESAYDQLLSQIDIMDPLLFEKESFEKGLTTSRAVTAVRESHSPDAPIVFRLLHEIEHSPIRMDDGGVQIATATIRTTFSEQSDNAKFTEFRDLFNGEEPIEIITTAGLSGDTDSVINVGAFDMTFDDDKNSLSVAKSTLNLITTGGRTQGNGTVGSITMSDSKGITSTGAPSELTFDVATTDYWKHDYDMLWAMSELTIESPELPTPAKITGLSIGTDSVVSTDSLSSNGFVEIEQIDLGDAIPMDVAPVTSGRMNFALKDVNLDAIQSYVDLVKQISIEDKPEQTQELSDEVLSALKQLVTKDVAAVYNITLDNAGGSANAEYLVRFVGDDSSTGYDNINTVADLSNALEMTLSIDADKSAIEMTPAIGFLQSPQAQMAFIDTGDQYSGKAALKGTTIDLNGELFQLRDMAGGMLEMPIEELLKMKGF